MIKNFESFFQKGDNKILKEDVDVASYIDDVDSNIAFDDMDLEDAKNFKEPDMVSDNKYLSSISRIVIKALNKRINTPFVLHPFILTVDGQKCAMIKSPNSYLVVFRSGINKKLAYFKSNPLEGDTKSEFSVSTSTLGFSAMVKAFVDMVSGGVGINEAKSVPEIGPAAKPAYAAYATICKKLNDTSSLPKDAMYEFLKLYEKYEDAEIKSMMLSDSTDLPEALQIIQKNLCVSKDGSKVDASATERVVKVVHMILCGVAYGLDGKEKKAMEDTWFWGAGKSGKLAIEYSESEGYVIKEAESVMEGRVDELERKMNAIYKTTLGVCKYIKSGGKDMSMRATMGRHRGILITGVAGIGKTVSLENAIKESGLKENIDYKKMGNSSTGSREVYKELYDGNNMLLIYDDTPEMFNAEGKISLWKLAMEGTENNRLVMSPDGKAGKNSTIFYNASDPDMTRQDRYFREIGKFTPYEKDTWIKKEVKRLRSEFSTSKRDGAVYSESTLISMAKEKFKEFEDNEVTSLMPDRFIFNGIIVYISNQTLASFEKTAKDHWDAISSRMTVFDISPTQKVIWAWLRRKILNDAADTSKLDGERIFPLSSDLIPDYSFDSVIEYIDDVMEGKFNDENRIYGKMNYRILSNLSEYIQFGNENWKDAFLGDMLITTNRIR